MNESIKGNILIVDDGKVNRVLIKRGLSKFTNMNLFEAASGKEAIEIVKKYPIDVILLDIIMPELDGFGFLEFWEKNEKLSNIQIIIVSAVDTYDNIYKALTMGCYDYIQKPLLENVVLKILPLKVINCLKYKKNIEHIEHINKNLEIEISKRMQDLIHAERLISIGVLTAGIIHDLNSPLTYLKGNIDLLSNMFPKYLENKNISDEDMKMLSKFNEMIRNSKIGIGQVIDIINNFRNYLKKDDEKSKQIDINEIVETSLEICSNFFKNIKVQKFLNKIPNVEANRSKIMQVIINILVNASQAVDNNSGSIDVITENHNDNIIINIIDNGKGISEETMKHLYEPFYTTKAEEGTGLGLYISKEIINQYGGKLEISSRLNEGTDVKLILPVYK